MKQTIRIGIAALAVIVSFAAVVNDALTAPSPAGAKAPGDFGPPRGKPLKAILTSPPNVPQPTGRNYPAKVIVELEVIEKDMAISRA